MSNQVITITPDGTMSGLQRKRGRGVDLRQFGHAAIERASEITWNEEQQLWYVCILSAAVHRGMKWHHTWLKNGIVLRMNHWTDMVGSDAPVGSMRCTSSDHTLEFYDYDDAVAAEVAFLDALRLRAVF